MSNPTPAERQDRRDYHREWRKNHPDNIIETQLRYWQKKARQAKQHADAEGAVDNSYQMEE